MHRVNYVDEVLEQRDVCCFFEKAPHAPLAGASAVPIFYEESQVDPSSLRDLTAFRAMGVFSKYFPLLPARQRNLQEVSDAIRGARIGFFGQLKCVQWDDGGGGKVRCGRTFVRSGESNFRFKDLARAPRSCGRNL